MSDSLNELERRVLGVLIEKSLAQPQYYPMTTNAIVAACNQKSNRDPEMDLDEDSVWQTLDIVRQKGLVSRLMPGGGSRTDRFKHESQTIFGWEKPQRAIMAELLLRGPQTLSELRTRCSRMFPFDSLEAVSAVLDTLMQRQPPHVAMLPRQPGQSATRYAHLFYPEHERPASEPPAAMRTAPDAVSATAAPAPAALPELDRLNRALLEAQAAIDDLRRRVEQLESTR